MHGWAQNWGGRKLMPGLSERFTVIVPELRGVGARSVPAGGFDKRTMAVDVLGLVDRLGLDDVSVVGHDIGPAGHWILQEQPGQILDALMPFLTRKT